VTVFVRDGKTGVIVGRAVWSSSRGTRSAARKMIGTLGRKLRTALRQAAGASAGRKPGAGAPATAGKSASEPAAPAEAPPPDIDISARCAAVVTAAKEPEPPAPVVNVHERTPRARGRGGRRGRDPRGLRAGGGAARALPPAQLHRRSGRALTTFHTRPVAPALPSSSPG
jgi:hypothetical protein